MGRKFDARLPDMNDDELYGVDETSLDVLSLRTCIARSRTENADRKRKTHQTTTEKAARGGGPNGCDGPSVWW